MDAWPCPSREMAKIDGLSCLSSVRGNFVRDHERTARPSSGNLRRQEKRMLPRTVECHLVGQHHHCDVYAMGNSQAMQTVWEDTLGWVRSMLYHFITRILSNPACAVESRTNNGLS